MSDVKFFHMVVIIGLPLGAYVLGSIPWGLVFARWFAAIDIRDRGSGNIGVTNVSRVAGTRPAILTLLGDISKGLIPAFLALAVLEIGANLHDTFLSVVALAAFFGHLYPVFLKFKAGGKGVATTTGCFIILSPTAVLIALGAFILLLLACRYVSMGSLAAALVLPFAVWFSTHSIALTAGAGIMAAFIFLRHAANIRRLLSGEEPHFRQKS
jgi:glycerol-3-phosphate acyltransferase PlsY